MNNDEVMSLRARFLSIEDFASQCHNKLAKYPDADNDWLLSRIPNLMLLVERLDKEIMKITGVL